MTVALRPEPLVVDGRAHRRGTTLAAHRARPGAATSSIEADVAEEIARVRGYELTPSVTPDTAMPAFRPSPLEVRELVRETLAGAGLTEVVTTALVSPRHLEVFAAREPRAVGRRRAAARRRADHASRTRSRATTRCSARTLLGSLLDVVGDEPAPRQRRTSRCSRSARATRGPATSRASGGGSAFALVGAAEPPAWNRPARPYDLDDAKGLLELLAAPAGPRHVRPTRPESGEAVFHPGRTARAEIAGPPRRRSSASCTRRSVDAWELRTGDAVIVARGRDRGPGGGAADARARAGRRASTRRSSATWRSSSPRRRPPRRSRRRSGAGAASCCATRACSTSTVARRSPATRRASRSACGSGAGADAHRGRGRGGRRGDRRRPAGGRRTAARLIVRTAPERSTAPDHPMVLTRASHCGARSAAATLRRSSARSGRASRHRGIA